jgi:hypothetical protein
MKSLTQHINESMQLDESDKALSMTALKVGSSYKIKIKDKLERLKFLGTYMGTDKSKGSFQFVTEMFKEKEGIIFIDSIIYVERDTQKGILIGHKGEAIKKVGTEARIDLEKFFDKKIHINLFVKVKKDWRKNERDLKNFGYR